MSSQNNVAPHWEFDCGHMMFNSVSQFTNRYGSTLQAYKYKQECLDACHEKYDCAGVWCPGGQHCVPRGKGGCSVDFECADNTAYNCSTAVDTLGRATCEARISLCQTQNIREGCQFTCNGCIYSTAESLAKASSTDGSQSSSTSLGGFSILVANIVISVLTLAIVVCLWRQQNSSPYDKPQIRPSTNQLQLNPIYPI